MIPPLSPAELVAILLAELVFGLFFNQFVIWARHKEIWPTAFDVVFGVTVTLLFPSLAWWRVTLDFWQASVLLALCFTASGIPMIVGSTHRKAEESHKRRPWPTAAAQARDAAIMDLNLLAEELANGKKNGAQVVNALHRIIGTLKSV